MSVRNIVPTESDVLYIQALLNCRYNQRKVKNMTTKIIPFVVFWLIIDTRIEFFNFFCNSRAFRPRKTHFYVCSFITLESYRLIKEVAPKLWKPIFIADEIETSSKISKPCNITCLQGHFCNFDIQHREKIQF